ARRSSPQCGPRPSFSPLSGVPVRSVYALCTRAVNPSVVEIVLNQYERTVVRDTQSRSQVTVPRHVHVTVGRKGELATLVPVHDCTDARLQFFQQFTRRGLARRDCNMFVVPPVRVHVVAQLQLDLRVQGRQVLDERSHGHSLHAVHSLDALHPSPSISFRISWYSVMSSIIAAGTARHGALPAVATRI